MSTFTSSLPNELLQELNQVAQKLSLPKNKILEKALRIYLNQIKRVEYIKYYQEISNDEDTLLIAAEGMEEYLRQLEKKDDLVLKPSYQNGLKKSQKFSLCT
ncbi:MAG: ribbon-helix-helix domain-containing protein [Flavobacteriales bacterium]|nr:ribbon-helix-helix domain-containing protein [Flavobacteriales bacterium]